MHYMTSGPCETTPDLVGVKRLETVREWTAEHLAKLTGTQP
jgi:hypothetical protein